MIRENEALLDRLNIVTDLVVLFLSIVLSYTVRFHIFDSTEIICCFPIICCLYWRFCRFIILFSALLT